MKTYFKTTGLVVTWLCLNLMLAACGSDKASQSDDGTQNNNLMNTETTSAATVDMTDLTPWPTEYMNGIPELQGKIVDVVVNEESVYVDLEYVEKSDFENYVEQLREGGYTVDVDETKESSSIDFRAYNENGDWVHAYWTAGEDQNAASIMLEKAEQDAVSATDAGEYLWLITIEEEKEGTLMGIYGSSEVPCTYTIELYAVNDNSPSPYEGEFTLSGRIHSYWNVKEDYEMPDVDALEFEADHVIQPCTFRLIPNDLAPLTEGSDSLLQESASAEFLMPTKGDNPANYTGAASGFEFGQNLDLDMAATCKLNSVNSRIELITDVFGSFNGKIERLETGDVPSEIELAPLVP
ncbi:MAG: hypothetical protein ACK5ML_14580 [Lachnospiraceae bacterium]